MSDAIDLAGFESSIVSSALNPIAGMTKRRVASSQFTYPTLLLYPNWWQTVVSPTLLLRLNPHERLIRRQTSQRQGQRFVTSPVLEVGRLLDVVVKGQSS